MSELPGSKSIAGPTPNHQLTWGEFWREPLTWVPIVTVSPLIFLLLYFIFWP